MNKGAASALQPLRIRREPAEVKPLRIHQPTIAEKHRRTVDLGTCSHAFNILEARRGRNYQALRSPQDGLCQRMI